MGVFEETPVESTTPRRFVMNVRRGVIQGFYGQWNSGMAQLVVQEDGAEKPTAVYCDNGATVRGLNGFYPGFITAGHRVDSDRIKGERIVFSCDEVGTLEGIIPEAFADSEDEPENEPV